MQDVLNNWYLLSFRHLVTFVLFYLVSSSGGRSGLQLTLRLFRFMHQRPQMPIYSWPFKGCSMRRIPSKGFMSKWRQMWSFTWTDPRENTSLLALYERKLFEPGLPLHARSSFSSCPRLPSIRDLWLLRERNELSRATCPRMPWLQQHRHMSHQGMQVTTPTQSEPPAWQHHSWEPSSRVWGQRRIERRGEWGYWQWRRGLRWPWRGVLWWWGWKDRLGHSYTTGLRPTVVIFGRH